MESLTLRLPYHEITSRQFDILILMFEGWSNDYIATMLGIANQTVRNHKHMMYRRIGVRNGREALIEATKRGWISGPST